MRVLFFGLIFLSAPLFAADSISFRNDRESESFYASRSTKKSVKRLLKSLSEVEIKNAYASATSDLTEAKLCSFDLNQKLKEKLPKNTDLDAVIHYLRSQNEIDDSVTKILLNANDVDTKIIGGKEEETLTLSSDSAKVETLTGIIGNFEKKYSKVCFDEGFKSLHSELQKEDKKIKSNEIEALLVKSLKDKKITEEVYQKLESARVAEVQKWSLSLKNYYQKIKSLRNQYPLRDSTEKSSFVTAKVKKQKLSRRQKLLENYSDIQIVLMANIIKKLRTRLDSQRMEILIFSKDETTSEIIPINPMDRFCFCIVKLREEMTMLGLNTYFNGRTPDYNDLVTASYEIGIIPASELDTVGGMEEIWNPKKKFMDKAKVWIKTIGGIASIVVPPPYGFIPALILVAIEASTTKEDTNSDPTKLFRCKN